MEEDEIVPDKRMKEAPAATVAESAPLAIKSEPMEVEIKKEREEGELEEGELPETKSMQTKKSVQPPSIVLEDSIKPKDVCSDVSVPFSQAQIRDLFKILPESSLMGAEVSRTFAQLCQKAILHKKIY